MKLTESQLKHLIAESVMKVLEEATDEAFSQNQYSFLAGRAQGMLNNNRMKAITDPKWVERKKRQAALFGQAASGQGNPNWQNNNRDTTSNMGLVNQSVNKTNYTYDNFKNQFNPQGRKDTNPFQMQRAQGTRGMFHNPGELPSITPGKENGQTASFDDMMAMGRNGQMDAENAKNLAKTNAALNTNYQRGMRSLDKNYGDGHNNWEKNFNNLGESLDRSVAESVKTVLKEYDNNEYAWNTYDKDPFNKPPRKWTEEEKPYKDALTRLYDALYYFMEKEPEEVVSSVSGELYDMVENLFIKVGKKLGY